MKPHTPVLTFGSPDVLFTDASAAADLWACPRTAAAAMFGAPLDLTASFRSGAAGGPSAVRWMSRSLEAYSPDIDRDLRDLSLLDIGDLRLEDASMEAALAAIADAMEYASSLARIAVMIGGEHTASLGAFRGTKRVYPDALLLQVDAHLDFRMEYEGEAITHASWMYHAGVEFGFDQIVQLGVRSGDRDEWSRARRHTHWSSTDLALPADVRGRLAAHPVYLTLDIDVLDPAFAPGTGCPEPGGVSFRELARFLYGLAGVRVVGLDVVEVAPAVDPSGITAVAAAKLIREAVLLFSGTERHEGTPG